MTIVHYSKLKNRDSFKLSEKSPPVFQLVESEMVIGVDLAVGLAGTNVFELDNLNLLKTLEPRLTFQGIDQACWTGFYYPNRGLIVPKTNSMWGIAAIGLHTTDHFILV